VFRVDRYVMLIASLPHHGPLFGARQTPLSSVKLERRLTALEPADAEQLRIIEQLLHWDRRIGDADYARLIERELLKIESKPLREIATAQLEMRTLVAALRRRRGGESAPGSGEIWGYNPWLDRMRRYWTAPDFGLQPWFPWIPSAEHLIRTDDALGLERLLLDLAWTQLSRAADSHYFDFEAVAIYVLRWHLVDRWTRRDSSLAARRFDTLVEQGLGDFRVLPT